MIRFLSTICLRQVVYLVEPGHELESGRLGGRERLYEAEHGIDAKGFLAVGMVRLEVEAVKREGMGE